MFWLVRYRIFIRYRIECVARLSNCSVRPPSRHASVRRPWNSRRRVCQASRWPSCAACTSTAQTPGASSLPADQSAYCTSKPHTIAMSMKDPTCVAAFGVKCFYTAKSRRAVKPLLGASIDWLGRWMRLSCWNRWLTCLTRACIVAERCIL